MLFNFNLKYPNFKNINFLNFKEGKVVNDFFSTNLPKIADMGIAIGLFGVVFLAVFFIASKANGKITKPISYVIFLGPALVLLFVGLLFPAIQTLLFSFKNSYGNKWVGFANYNWLLHSESFHSAFINTILWIAIVPFATTGFGLLLAILSDRLKRESIPQSLIFMAYAMPFVGAAIIWQYIYLYANPSMPQTGLLSSLARLVGVKPLNWMLTQPLNVFLLMIIFVWAQTGFCMVILSAAIKGVPLDIVEASALDGAGGWRMFRYITFPSIRPSFIVVLATMAITTLKLFDIVRTVTGGNFGTSVLSNEMFSTIFVYNDQGRGSAMAIILFLLVTPIMIYNIKNLRKQRKIS